jgi:hypothetical protein
MELGMGHYEWMRLLLGQGSRNNALLSRLVWITQKPQNPGCKEEGNCSRLYATVEEHRGIVALSVI